MLNREHADRLEYRDQAELTFPADRCRVLNPFVVIGERFRAVPLQLRDDVAMDDQRRSEEPRKWSRLDNSPGAARHPGRPGMVTPHRCRIGDGGT